MGAVNGSLSRWDFLIFLVSEKNGNQVFPPMLEVLESNQ